MSNLFNTTQIQIRDLKATFNNWNPNTGLLDTIFGSDGLPTYIFQAYDIDFSDDFTSNFNQQSVGTGLSSQPLPRRLSIGTAYYPVNGLMTSLVLDRLLGQDIQIKYGMKYEFSKIITMNIGAQSGYRSSRRARKESKSTRSR